MINESETYDVCVIGAGVEGSSTARYCASRGKKTLLLEQFPLPHSNGSSHGATRLVRHGYSDSTFSNLMPEAFEMWADVEKRAGKQMIKRVGLFSGEGPPFAEISKLAINVRNLGVKCETLSPQDIKKRFPMFNLPPDWSGTFEPEGGFILANKALQALQQQFVKFGGKLCDGEKVVSIEPGTVVTVHTCKGVYKAKSIIITAGPWVNEVLKPLDLKIPVEAKWLKDCMSLDTCILGSLPMPFVLYNLSERDVKFYQIWRVILSYWEPQNPKSFSIESGFPGFIFYGTVDSGIDHVYGFPVFDYPGLMKICHHTGVPISVPQARDDVRKDETYIERSSKVISENFIGIKPEPKIVDPCIYTVTPDSSFILDYHPLHRNIVIGAGFSGHGFKMAPLIGKILSQLAFGEKPSYDMTPFKISRFKTPKASL